MAGIIRRFRKWLRLAVILPVLLFLLSAALFLSRGREGLHHAKAVELWQQQEWHELRALAANLEKAQKVHAESLFLAMLASEKLGNKDGVRHFAERLLQQRVLHWRMERELARVYQPNSLRTRLALYRTRIAFALGILTGVFLLASMLLRRQTLPWVAVSSALGCVSLLV